MSTTALQLGDALPTSEVRKNLSEVATEVSDRPGLVVRFGRHRRAETAMMSQATLDDILRRLRELEDELLLAKVNRLVAAGGESVPAELVEDGYVPPTAEEAAEARERFRAAARVAETA